MKRIAAFLIVLLGALAGAGYLLSRQLTRRHTPDERRSPAEYGLSFEEVAFRSRDGLLLHGWWIPAPGARRAVIFMHGHGGSMDPDVQYAPAFHAAGISVLMFDFRAHGRSEGHITTVGYLERQDALGAIDYALNRGIEQVGLLGFSMGGIVAMLTAPLSPAARAVVSDGGPVRMVTSLTVWGQERGIPGPLAAVMARVVLIATSLRVGANQFSYEPLRWVSQIAPRPLLLIQGGHDQYVPPADFAALQAAAGPTAQTWFVPDAGHRTADQLYPDEYRRRVVGFFEENL